MGAASLKLGTLPGGGHSACRVRRKWSCTSRNMQDSCSSSWFSFTEIAKCRQLTRNGDLDISQTWRSAEVGIAQAAELLGQAVVPAVGDLGDGADRRVQFDLVEIVPQDRVLEPQLPA